MSTNFSPTKKNIRQSIKKDLQNFSKEKRYSLSDRIRKRFFILLEKWFPKSSLSSLKIMSYVSLESEVDTVAIIKKIIKMNRVIWIPRCNGDKIESVKISSLEGLQPGRFGIHEPGQEFSVFKRTEELDMVIVPGLGFDRFCNRLGRGKGYFDRFLSSLGNHPVTIGLAFDIQIVDFIPCNDNDRSLDFVLTETSLYSSGNKPLPFSLPLP
ncbi:MAG: 5-formyltetrahydrofolate cyclo-ligase [Candidatus Aureabacteria bacterium]|nr:5-formyltetrahydrofolate cyclo-ligase [Candidatus Auribacterota bacterium]